MNVIAIALLLACAGSALAQCPWLPELRKTSIAINLPDEYNSPDGMVCVGDTIYLSINNSIDPKYPGVIVKFGKDCKVEKVTDLPLHPDTKKALPLGIEMAPDGNLYVADCQTFAGAMEHKSRLFRVNMKDGRAAGVDVVVDGFVMANAVSYFKDAIYVTDTQIDLSKHPAGPAISGVFRIPMKELNALKQGEVIHLKPGVKDRRLVATFETRNPHWAVGANGMGFNSKGEMFVCNFAEASIHKITLDEKGRARSNVVFARCQGMESTDGMKVDANDDIYVADFLGNAVHKVDGKTGKVTTLARNALCRGENGELVKPSEVCIRDGKVYVSNINLNLDGNTHGKPYTISVFDLKK
jgi:sugar lactone lactonase YvrE